MPNFKKHVTVGAVVGGSANLAWQLYNIFYSSNRPKGFWETVQRIDFVELVLFTAGGAAVAALPDLIEPTSNPNHRAMFHSLTCAGAITYSGFGKHSDKMLPHTRHALQVAALSYLSHLLLDSSTPKGIPIAGLLCIEI